MLITFSQLHVTPYRSNYRQRDKLALITAKCWRIPGSAVQDPRKSSWPGVTLFDLSDGAANWQRHRSHDQDQQNSARAVHEWRKRAEDQLNALFYLVPDLVSSVLPADENSSSFALSGLY